MISVDNDVIIIWDCLRRSPSEVNSCSNSWFREKLYVTRGRFPFCQVTKSFEILTAALTICIHIPTGLVTMFISPTEPIGLRKACCAGPPLAILCWRESRFLGKDPIRPIEYPHWIIYESSCLKVFASVFALQCMIGIISAALSVLSWAFCIWVMIRKAFAEAVDSSP